MSAKNIRKSGYCRGVQIARAQISATPDERGVTMKYMRLASAAKSRFDMFLPQPSQTRSRRDEPSKKTQPHPRAVRVVDPRADHAAVLAAVFHR